MTRVRVASSPGLTARLAKLNGLTPVMFRTLAEPVVQIAKVRNLSVATVHESDSVSG